MLCWGGNQQQINDKAVSVASVKQPPLRAATFLEPQFPHLWPLESCRDSVTSSILQRRGPLSVGKGWNGRWVPVIA